jgi:hypothetical protein
VIQLDLYPRFSDNSLYRYKENKEKYKYDILKKVSTVEYKTFSLLIRFWFLYKIHYTVRDTE